MVWVLTASVVAVISWGDTIISAGIVAIIPRAAGSLLPIAVAVLRIISVVAIVVVALVSVVATRIACKRSVSFQFVIDSIVVLTHVCFAICSCCHGET